MPSKKKKYNARFPAGRIKKIMQTDEEVGKVAKAVPVIISRTLELFIESLIKKSVQITLTKNARTLSPHHMKLCILSESRFDFLRELVKCVPEVSSCDDELNSFGGETPSISLSLQEERRNSRGASDAPQELDATEQQSVPLQLQQVPSNPHPQLRPHLQNLQQPQPQQPPPQPPPPPVSHGLNFYTERDISVTSDPDPDDSFPAGNDNRPRHSSYSISHRSKSLADNNFDRRNPRSFGRSHSSDCRQDPVPHDYNT